jgi:predicted secreted protein
MGLVGNFRTETAGGAAAGNAGIQVDDFGQLETTATNALKTSFASSTSPQTITYAGLNGAAKPLSHPRTITITLSNSVGAFTTSAATITGTCRGVAQSASLTFALNGNTTLETAKCFDVDAEHGITIVIPACATTGGTITIGIGDGVAFSVLPMEESQLGLPLIVAVHVDGLLDAGGNVFVPNGSVASPPYGKITFVTPLAHEGAKAVTYLVAA